MKFPSVLLFAFFRILVITNAFPQVPENLNNLNQDSINGTEDNLDGKVIFGDNATNGQFPFMVFLKGLDGWICSASIISKYYVITAAHCVFRNGLVVNVATFTGCAGNVDYEKASLVISFRHISVHPFFQRAGAYDIALLRTREAIPFDRFIQPIRMGSWELLFSTEFHVKLIGWGYTNCHIYGPGTPHPFHKYTNILQFSKSVPVYFESNGNELQLCHGVDVGGICGGDSGGAMIVETSEGPVLVGIIATMIPSFYQTAIAGCSNIVSNYADFIKNALMNAEKTLKT